MDVSLVQEIGENMNKIILDVQNVGQWFDKNKVLQGVDLKIAQGQFVSMVGGSGCGKSTLLRAILGTVPQKSGTIEIDGKEVHGPNRDIGIVYQRYGLYQFLTAEQNVAFGPMLDETEGWQRIFMPRKWKKLREKHLEEARELLIKFKLEHALSHYPSELSGGMQQRVAIAQALIMKPKILLLDEPFGALDESTREDLQDMLLTLYQENIDAKKNGEDPPWTVLIITHELNEAFYVSDRVVGLSKNWEDGELNGKTEGATKVWDQSAPIYYPGEARNYDAFAEMKADLRKYVLDDNAQVVGRNDYVNFWSDLENGIGTGVSITKRGEKKCS